MMLSEYILQMHTTPVACNSVSGGLQYQGCAVCSRWGMAGCIDHSDSSG
jgi:hypothetical protein